MKFDKSKAYPIAMRCNEEQFESIRPILEGIEWVEIRGVSNFKAFPILVNNLWSEIGVVNNISEEAKNAYNRQVHETFNADIFLDACGRVKETRWRFKTKEEFEATCEKNEGGNYDCGQYYFTPYMFELLGKEYEGSPDNLIGVKTPDGNSWFVTPEMLVPMEEEVPSEHPQFEPKMRGGYDYNIIRKDRGDGMMTVEFFNGSVWILVYLNSNGRLNKNEESELDLIPISQYTYHIIRNGQELNSLDELESYDTEPSVKEGEVVVKRRKLN